MVDVDFARLIFSAVLSIQYHPRNDVLPEDDPVVIERCIRVTALAVTAFNNAFVDDIPF